MKKNKKDKQGKADSSAANASNPNSPPRQSVLGATSASAFEKATQSILTTDPETLLIEKPSPKQSVFERAKGSVAQTFRRKSTSNQEPRAQESGSISATAAQTPLTETIASTPSESAKSVKNSIFANLPSPLSALGRSISASKNSIDASNSTKEKKRWSLTIRGKNKQDNDPDENIDQRTEKVAIKKVASSDSAKQRSIGLFDSPDKTDDFKHFEEGEVSMSGNSAANDDKKGRRKNHEKKQGQISTQTTQGSNGKQNKVSQSSLVKSVQNKNDETVIQEEHNETVVTNMSSSTVNQSPKKDSATSSFFDEVINDLGEGTTKSSLLDQVINDLGDGVKGTIGYLKKDISDNLKNAVHSLASSGLGMIPENDQVDNNDTKDKIKKPSDSSNTQTDAVYLSLRPQMNQSMDQSMNQSINVQTPAPGINTSKPIHQPHKRQHHANSQQPKDEPKSIFQRFIAGIGAAFSAVGTFLYSFVKPIINVIWPDKDRNDNVPDYSSEHSQEPDSTLNHSDDSSDNDTNGLKHIHTVMFSDQSTNRRGNNHGNNNNTETKTKKTLKGFGCSIN